MTYLEMKKAESELKAALAPVKRQRGATRAQLAYRAQRLGYDPRRHERCICGETFANHTNAQLFECANARS